MKRTWLNHLKAIGLITFYKLIVHSGGWEGIDKIRLGVQLLRTSLYLNLTKLTPGYRMLKTQTCTGKYNDINFKYCNLSIVFIVI